METQILATQGKFLGKFFLQNFCFDFTFFIRLGVVKRGQPNTLG
jgi:hypothetical protein